MSASGFARDLDLEFRNKLIHAMAAVPSARAYMAYGCYDDMQRWGPTPNKATYYGLMAVCARDGDAARAMALRREMEHEGLEVTTAVYCTLISEQCKAGEWEAPVKAFREMRAKARGGIEGKEMGGGGGEFLIGASQSEGRDEALQAAVSIFREAAAGGTFLPALTADPFTCYVVGCTPRVAAVAILSLLLCLASSSIFGRDAAPLRNLLIVTKLQATVDALPHEPCPGLQGTMETMLQVLGLKGERLHGTSVLQGLCVDKEDLRLWLKTQAALVFGK
ncbi:unnamed protein product [Closterium sp. NIES-65]|nr:unnamed protein product [Closterium sp. NIES-65]